MRVSEAKGCKPSPRICEANRRVIFSGVQSKERMRYIENKNRGGQSFFYFFQGRGFFVSFFLKKKIEGAFILVLFLKEHQYSNIYKYVSAFAYQVGNMDTKNITLKVNSDLYDNYREYCKKKGLIVSRQFEIMIEKQLREGAKSQ